MPALTNDTVTMYMCLGLLVLNCMLIIAMFYLIIRLNGQERYMDIYMERTRNAFVYTNAVLNSLEENNKRCQQHIDSLEYKLERLQGDMKCIESGMERFAPPLEKDKNFKTITVLNKTL